MVTRKQLEEYREGEREVRELRAKMRQAEIRAMESEREEDRRRAREAAAVYDASADLRSDELMRIEMEIDGLPRAEWRRVIRMRYIEGRGIGEICRRMAMSERLVYYAIRDAVDALENNGESGG